MSNILIDTAPNSSADYQKLYNSIAGQIFERNNQAFTGEKSKTILELEPVWSSSSDYNQTAQCLLEASENLFWSSKGSDTPQASEFIIFKLKTGNLISPDTIEVQFYEEDYFEEDYNFFSCWGLRVYGSMTCLFDEEHEYGYFEINSPKHTDEIIQNCKQYRV